MSKSKRVLRADFHVHTYHSLDSNLTPKSIIDRAKEIGLDVVGVVDHGSVEGGKETETLARKVAKDLIVFAGEEIRTSEGEIMAFNIDRTIPQLMDLIETCEIVKKLGGFIVLPHPFDRLRGCVGKSAHKIVKYVDAVEGFNARSVRNGFNKKAVKFSKENGLPLVAGSDAHFSEEIGKGITLIDSEWGKEGVLKAIRSGKTEISGEKSGIKPHIKTFFQKFR
ncbi:MAG: PHP domain-containing protein [Candidatus Aenigmarchaeota archaeon]|nr:PHP domain-containing protein [Candidatus Aenigmarchaeota archaeon]NIP39915.1 PHP domain-containing protein [Candidatus Aenigmarchaeota archaeon]NIQ17634.1 PHP domain-containing protein [Candidatus Aenigmarchaeota archaeon]NIS72822.1 PHP domain-containing protein [Candidatus Aenigmarchaeota archaeon]